MKRLTALIALIAAAFQLAPAYAEKADEIPETVMDIAEDIAEVSDDIMADTAVNMTEEEAEIPDEAEDITEEEKDFAELCALSGTCGDNVKWSLSDEGILNIYGSGSMKDCFYDYIPWMESKNDINKVIISPGITSIGDFMFHGCANITSVNIPSTVMSIGEYAFSGCSLRILNLPASIISIRDGAFNDCNLDYVTFPLNEEQWNRIDIESNNDILSKAKMCFNYTGLITGELEEGLIWTLSEDGILTISGNGAMISTYVNNYPWYSIKRYIKKAVIEDGVTEISANAFYECYNLEELYISGSVRLINNIPFINSPRIVVDDMNGNYLSEDGALYNKEMTELLAVPNKQTGTFVIQDGITNVKCAVFKNCKVTEIVIPESVTKIEGEYYNYNYFVQCNQLETITVDSNNAVYSSLDGVLFDKSLNELISYPIARKGAYTVPNVVKRIKNDAFKMCKGLTSVNITENVYSIGSEAFESCNYLEKVFFGKNIKSIGYDAFKNCSNLKNIEYDGSIKDWDMIWSRSDGAAESGLDKVRVNYLQEIETNGECGKELTWQLNKQNGVLSITGKGIMESYGGKNSVPWYAPLVKSAVIEEGAVSISGYVFSGCTDLESVVIPDTVISINNNVFRDCNSGVVIRGYTGSEAEAFAARNNIVFDSMGEASEKIIITDKCGDDLTWSLDTMGNLTISGTGEMNDYEWRNEPWYSIRNSIKNVVVEEGATSIGIYSFLDCTNLINVTFPKSLTKISDYAFDNCRITEIKIPQGVEYIGRSAFEKCEIKELDIPQNVNYIGNRAFCNNSDLDIITTSNEVIQFGKEVFADTAFINDKNNWDNFTLYIGPHLLTADREKLEGSYKIKEGTLDIADGAFEYCERLEEVRIPKSVVRINGIPFINSNADVIVDIENGSYSSADGVLFDKSGETLLKFPAKRKGSYSLPDGVKVIASDAFYLSQIDTVILSSGVTEIEGGAFWNSHIKNIMLPDSIKRIGRNAFFNMYGPYMLDIYYGGTEEEWGLIQVGSDQSAQINNADIHFNAVGIKFPVIISANAEKDETGGDTMKIIFSDTDYTSSLIMGFYRDGHLVTTKQITVKTGDDTKEIPIPQDIDADEAKVFIWSNNRNLRALCEAMRVEL